MLRRSQAIQLSRILTPVPSDQHPWPSRISGQFGGPPVDLVHVDPTCVAEVAVDRALQGKRWRHPIRLLRLRLDLQAAEVPPTADEVKTSHLDALHLRCGSAGGPCR